MSTDEERWDYLYALAGVYRAYEGIIARQILVDREGMPLWYRNMSYMEYVEPVSPPSSMPSLKPPQPVRSWVKVVTSQAHVSDDARTVTSKPPHY